MKNKNKSDKLKVIIINPPTKEQAKKMIQKISEEINELYNRASEDIKFI